MSWHAKCSLPVAVRVSKTRVLKLPNISTLRKQKGLGTIGVRHVGYAVYKVSVRSAPASVFVTFVSFCVIFIVL